MRNSQLVRSEAFQTYKVIGDPVHEVIRFSEWAIDELIYLDISNSNQYDQTRQDKKIQAIKDRKTLIQEISKNCFVPLTFGGGLRTVECIKECILNGADKVSVSTMLHSAPKDIQAASEMFGKQSIVACIDIKRIGANTCKPFIKSINKILDITVEDYIHHINKLGVGEILIQSVDQDGKASGFDIPLIRQVTSLTNLPLIALGGAGCASHFTEVFLQTDINAAAAANIFHFKELINRHIKRDLQRNCVNIRTA